MKKNSFSLLMAMGCLVIMTQACAPTATLKKPDTTLPKTFPTGEQNEANTSSVEWRDFFEDPDLLSLIEAAVANNKEVNILLQRINTAENEVQARKGEYLPFVSFGAGADVENVGHYTLDGAIEENLEIVEEEKNPEYLTNYQLGLFSTWEIDVWKKLRNASQVAAFEYMASKEGRNFLVTNLVAEIAHSYYELVALDNQLVNLEQNLQLQVKGIDVIKQLIQFGRANLLALKRYEAEVNKNKSEIYKIVQEIVEVENRINMLMGRMPQPIQRSSGGFLDFKPQMMQAGIPSQLLQNRPDIRKAELELTASNLNIEVARASFYPSLEIKAGIGYQAFQTSYLFLSPESLAVSAVGEITAPIFNRSAIIANFKNANAKQIQSAYEYEQTVLNAFSEVANKMSSIENLEKQYQLKSEQVRALDQSIDLASQLFQSARAEYLEVLLTQREALEAKMELIEIKQKQISGTVDLYRALGGGWQ